MNYLHPFLNWFTGGANPYMRLSECMMQDWFWITVTVTLDLLVAAGYVVIALHWWRNSRLMPPIPAKRALSNMRNIFAFCGVCGYLFIPIKMFWPAWRLYDFFMAFLVYFTWRYALGTQGMKVVYQDLGRAEKLAEDLKNSREESKRKSFFLNSLSHDLRTPLNGLLLQINLADMGLDGNDPDMIRSALAEIKTSANATAVLLDAVLECARLDGSGEHNNVSRFDLAPLLNGIAETFEADARQKRLPLRARCAPLLALQTDRIKLERILYNLVSNAVKFTERGEIRLEAQSGDSGTEIHVIDTGIGIDPEVHPRLFDEFYQVQNHARDPNKGFGLGLSIARRLARQLGGDVTLESAPGRGSRFTVILPGFLPVADAKPDLAPAVAIAN